MEFLHENARETPVHCDVDVVVVGGGPAGFIAAAAAAQHGASTVLIERYGFLGGMATAALVGPLTAIVHRYGGGQIVGGLPWNFVRNLLHAGGAMLPTDHPGAKEENQDGEYERSAAGDIPFDPEVFKLVADQTVRSAGVRVLLHSYAVSPLVEDGKVFGVAFENKAGRQAVGCRFLVDATGDADLAIRAGAEWKQGDDAGELQPMTLMFRLSNVDTESLGNIESPHIPMIIRQAAKQLADAGELPIFGGPWTFWGSTFRAGEVMVNMVRLWGDATDPVVLTTMEQRAREHMHRFVGFLRDGFPAFANARLMDSGAQIGIRETRRIRGDYELSGEDLETCREFEDAIALGGHVIDIHSTNGSYDQVRRRVAPYQIPLRSLLPQGLQNVLVAGRPISADHRAHASLRVMGTCMATGQAAGVHAAIAAKHGLGLRAVPFSEIAASLDEMGALRIRGIPNWRSIL